MFSLKIKTSMKAYCFKKTIFLNNLIMVILEFRFNLFVNLKKRKKIYIYNNFFSQTTTTMEILSVILFYYFQL